MENTILHKNRAVQQKVDVLIAQAEAKKKINPELAFELAKEAVEYAECIDYKAGLAKSHYIAGVTGRLTSNFKAATSHFNKALDLFSSLNDKKSQSRVLNSLGNVYLSLSDFAQAIEYFDECRYVLESIGDLSFEAVVLSNKGLTYQQQGNLISSLENYLHSLSIYKTVQKPVPHTLINNIGIVYLEIGNFYVALKYFNSALKIAEESRHELNESFTLANIGRTYIYMDDCSNAITYLSEALILIRKLGNRQAESQIFSNLGKAFMRLRCFPEANTYLNKALKYYKEIGDKSSVAHAMSELGELYYHLNDFAASKNYYADGLKNSIEIDDEVNEARNCIGLASLYIKFMDLNKADEYLKRAIVLSEKRKSYKELAKIFKLLSDGYMAVGKDEESNQYLEMHYDYMKKLITLEEENSLKVFTATQNFHTSDNFKPEQMEKSEYYENYLNIKNSEALKRTVN